MRTLQRLAITLVAITLLAGLGTLPLSADSITTNGWVLGTPLPSWIVRLEPLSDPIGDSAATAMNDVGAVVGNASSFGGSLGTIWNAPLCIGCDSTPGQNWEFVFPPNAADGSSTEALDVTDSGLVLFSFHFSVDPGNYQIFDMNTGAWSAPGTSPAALGWTHTPELTNDKGWTVEYGTVFDVDGTTVLGRQAFLLETPEPRTLALLAVSLVALSFLERSSQARGIS
jgi:hypothetical protein